MRRRAASVVREMRRLAPSLLLALLVCTPAAVAEAEPVRAAERIALDGASLYLEVRGAERSAPVLLWLHGGPGGAERPLFRYFNGELERHFVVAYWDQRGAGRSFDPEADPRQLTIARHLADLDAVVDHLRRSFARDELVLVGHSWGGALGLLYARANPGKLSAFLAVAPMVDMRAQQQAEYEFVLAEATRRNDADALARLREVGPPPWQTSEDVLAVERISDRYGGVFHQPPNRALAALSAMLRGIVTPWEIARIIRANAVTLDAMESELLELDLTDAVPSVDVPVFFLLGRHDRHVDARLAERYLERLGAPAKQLIWFERSAHNVPFEEPERFHAAVREAVASIGLEAGHTESAQ